MGNPVGVTDTINRPPRSTRRMHSPFLSISPRSRLLRRSGLCYLTTFRRPFRAPFDWGVSVYRGSALTGSTTCLWSVALSGLAWCGHPSGLRLVARLLRRGSATASPPACGLLPFQGLLGAGIRRGFVGLGDCCAGVPPCRTPPPAYGLSPFQGLLGAGILRGFVGLGDYYTGVAPCRATPPACGLLPFQGLLGAGIRRSFVGLGDCCAGGSALSGSTACLWSVAPSGLTWCGYPSGLRWVGRLLRRGLRPYRLYRLPVVRRPFRACSG